MPAGPHRPRGAAGSFPRQPAGGGCERFARRHLSAPRSGRARPFIAPEGDQGIAFGPSAHWRIRFSSPARQRKGFQVLADGKAHTAGARQRRIRPLGTRETPDSGWGCGALIFASAPSRHAADNRRYRPASMIWIGPMSIRMRFGIPLASVLLTCKDRAT